MWQEGRGRLGVVGRRVLGLGRVGKEAPDDDEDDLRVQEEGTASSSRMDQISSKARQGTGTRKRKGTHTHGVDDADEVEELRLGEVVEEVVVRQGQAEGEDDRGELRPGLVPGGSRGVGLGWVEWN